MNKMKGIQIALTAALLIVVSAVATHATVLRAFVSSTGNDANAGANCPQATPCKTFAGAFPVVTAGGELIALDTSGYGPLTNINKAITIATAPGATAFVVAATGTAGFTVGAGPTDLVILRNINFNGSNAATTTGIQHNSGKLFIQDCKFAQLTTGLSTVAKLDLINCDFTGNSTGVLSTGQGTEAVSSTTSSTAQVRINGGNITNNTVGLSQANPGNGCFNIFVYQSNGVIFGNLIGNVTNQNCTATCNQGGSPGFFSFGTTLH